MSMSFHSGFQRMPSESPSFGPQCYSDLKKHVIIKLPRTVVIGLLAPLSYFLTCLSTSFSKPYDAFIVWYQAERGRWISSSPMVEQTRGVPECEQKWIRPLAGQCGHQQVQTTHEPWADSWLQEYWVLWQLTIQQCKWNNIRYSITENTHIINASLELEKLRNGRTSRITGQVHFHRCSLCSLCSYERRRKWQPFAEWYVSPNGCWGKGES